MNSQVRKKKKVVNEQRKRCSTLQVNREMQIKITIVFYYSKILSHTPWIGKNKNI